jgi:glycosyltransferase involved in cell wall biosynthesis
VIVYFGGTGYDGVAGTDRHLADELSDLTPVLYVDPPRSILTPLLRPQLADSMRGPALTQAGPALWRLIPRVLPGAHRPGVHRSTQVLMRRKVRQAVAELGRRVEAVVVATYDDLLGTVPGARTVFYATDDLVAGAALMGLPADRLLAGERRNLAGADEVAVVSPGLRDRFAGLGRTAVLIPNGCSPRAYEGVESAPLPEDAWGPDAPVAGFVGNINARIDLSLLEAVADDGHRLLLVGPHDPAFEPDRFRALTARGNVRWVGRKPFAKLPSYLRIITVGLTPYAAGDFNRASFPLKTLEYLAAGRDVVSTPLPATEWLRADPEGAALINVAAPGTFAGTVRERLARRDDPKIAARRRAFAAHHGWDRRARELAELIGIETATRQQEAGRT